MAYTPNRPLVAFIIYAALLCGILFTLFLIFASTEALSTIDKLSIKILLIFVIDLLIGLIALSIYKYYYLPSSRQLVTEAIRIILFVGTTIIGAPIGLSTLEKFKVERGDSVVEISFNDFVGYPTVLIVAIYALLLLILIHYHISISKFEQEKGIPLA